jgi:T5SS/PEP-CTERM-associated repeat protein/uncharacterized repeat protein (TIGR03803 family)
MLKNGAKTEGNDMAGTWTWIGTSDVPSNPGNWTLTAGSSGTTPQSGDTAIFPGGTTVPPLFTDTSFSNNNLDLINNATVEFSNTSTASTQPSIDGFSTIDAAGSATALSIAGPFTNLGTIEVTGAQNTLGIILTAGSAAGGMLLNYGQITVGQNDTLTMTGGTLETPGEVAVNGGTAVIGSTLAGLDNFAVGTGGSLELTQPGSNALTEIGFTGTTGLVKIDAPTTFVGGINGFALGDTLDLGVFNAATVIFDGNGDITVIGTNGVFTASDQSANPLDGFDHQGTFTLTAAGGLAGNLNVVEGSGGDTVLTALSPSTWQWENVSNSWSLVSGPGNGWLQPQQGDTAIINAGTVSGGTHLNLVGNTIELGGTGGMVAAFFAAGDTSTTASNPTIDHNSVIDSAVPGVSGPETSVLGAGGIFINEGLIDADGPAGSSFTIEISSATVDGGTFQPGYFINYNQIEVGPGNSMTIMVAGTSELLNASEIQVNGGTLDISVSGSAIAGGYAPGTGVIVIDGGGTVITNVSYASTISGMLPVYAFADATAGNTLKIENVRSFGGEIFGFGQNDTIDFGSSLAVGTVVYNSTSGILELESATGSIIAAVQLASGNFLSAGTQTGTFAVSGTVAGPFDVLTGADGDTILTTGVANDYSDNGSGAWQAGSVWAGGSTPGTLDTVLIGINASAPFTLTTGSTLVTVGALALTSDSTLLQITSNTTVSPYPIRLFAGTLEVGSGYTLTASAISQSSGTSLLDAGSMLDLTGSPVDGVTPNYNIVAANNGTISVSNSGTAAIEFSSGTVLVNGGTLNAGSGQSGGDGGSINIGYEGGGTPASFTVENSGSQAGVVMDTYAIVASDPTSFGVLTLDGNVTWTDQIDPHDTVATRGYMIVGDNAQTNNTALTPAFSGTATLVVENGATLTDQTYSVIGASSDSAGSVLVSGGLWNIGSSTTGGFLDIGLDGDGTLFVTGGGTVAVGKGGTFLVNGTSLPGGGINLGGASSGSGTLVVSGAGALVTDKAGLNVGLAGTGDLQVLNGGTILLNGTNGISIGTSAGASGTFLVSGTDFSSGAPALVTLAATAKGITAGASGQGELDVESGGTIALNGTGGIGIGQSIHGSGLVIVNGLGALINEGTASNGIGIAQAGTSSGTLLITNGGTVSLNGTASSAGMNVGQSIGAHGLVLVSGTNSTLSLMTPGAGLTVGGAGQGTLEVRGGGLVSVSGKSLSIGTGTSGSGTVSVSGVGSSITTLGTTGINVGATGAGVLTIGSGGSVSSAGGVTVAGGTIGSGSLTINGGTLNETSSMFSIGGTNTTGTLLVEGGGLLSTSLAAGQSFASGEIDAQGTGYASATVSGGTWIVNGSVNDGDRGTGSLDINSNGLVVLTGTYGMTLGNAAGSSGTLSVEGGGTLIGGGMRVATPFNGGSSTGIITVGNGGTVEATSLTEGGGGTITVGGTVNPAVLTDSGSLNIGQSGSTAALLTINTLGTVTQTGSFSLQIGSNTGSSGTVTVNGGTLTANGIGDGSSGTGVLIVENGGIVFDNGGTNQSTSIGSGFGGGFSGSGTLIVNGGTLNETGNSFQIGGTNTTGTLLVEGGGILNTAIPAGSFGIGGEINASGTGHAAATVSDGAWNVAGQLNVGDTGSGSLDINTNGLVDVTSNSGINIGNQAGAAGTVSVEGGGTLITTGGLSIANLFTGTASGLLNVGDGGTVDVGFIREGGGGTITVGGTASPALLISGILGDYIGGSGPGATLIVNQLGTVTANKLTIGSGGSGTVTVNGGTLTGGLSVQGGVLTVAGGGLVNSGTYGATVGSFSPGLPSTVVVDGGTLSDQSYFTVDSYSGGSAMVLVEGGGTLITGNSTAVADIYANGTSQAAAVVSGGTWIANGQIIVGDFSGTGSLDINANGIVNAGTNGISIGNNAGASGTISVESGGTLIGGSLNVANTITGTATGVLTVGDGGTVQVGSLTESGGGTITVGGTAHSALLTASGFVTIGQSGTGAALTINQYGTVTDSGTSSPLQIGSSVGSSGTVTVNGGTLITDGFGVGGTGTGTLTVENGGLVIDNGGTNASSVGSGFGSNVTITSTPSLTTLVNFNGTDGNDPNGGLITDAAGDLFGTTYSGGANGDGTVFEIAKTGGSYAGTPTTLASFNGTDGSAPSAGLITDAAGDLFGTTYNGGANSDGTVFEIAKTGGSYATTPTTLVSFNNTNGENPEAGLIVDAAGDLFGTTSDGGAGGYGTVFEIAHTGGSYASTPTTLVSFNHTDGTYPFGGLIADAAGDLFGTTWGGGANGDGTVFEIANTGGSYASTPATLVSFNNTDGANPYGNLAVDAAGDLFGTAGFGGANGDGTVFEIANTGGTYASTPTTLVNFNGADGAYPLAGLIADAAGNLFGATSEGGANGDGTVFEIAKTGGTYASTPTTLASFNGTNGKYPPAYASLVADAAGNLFGATTAGGANGDGTVFELSGINQGPTVVSTSGSGSLVINGGTLNETGTSFNVGGTNTAGTLLVENGGLLNTSSTAGLFSGIAGEINASGTGQASAIVSGGTWNVNGQLNVGDTGTGSLDIDSNGVVNAGTNGISIGNQGSGAGTVSVLTSGLLLAGALSLDNSFANNATGSLDVAGGTVSVGSLSLGADSTVTVSSGSLAVSGNVTIGNNGTGAMLGVTGGDVTLGSVNVAFNSGSTGTVTVDGGTLDTTGLLTVGNAGNGLVTVGLGGTLIVAGGLQVDLAAVTSGNGTLAVDGGSVTVSNGLSVGNGGTAVLVVDAGGTLTATGGTTFNIGSPFGGIASVTVNDGYLSTSGAPLDVGFGGTGSMLVENAGTVITTFNGGGPGVDINAGSGGQASATVTGTGSTWDLEGTASQFVVGDNGAGSLTISAGGGVNVGTAAVDIGNQSLGTGTVVVAGGTLTETVGAGGILIGFSGGASELAIESGGLVSAGGTVQVGTGSSILLSGGTLSAPVASAGTISGFGILSGPLANNATVVASGGTLDVSGGVTGSGGTITIAGNAAFESDGALGSGQSVVFGASANPADLILGLPQSTNAFSIVNMQNGDSIVFNNGVSVTGDQWLTGSLDVFTSGGTYDFTNVGLAVGTTAIFSTGSNYVELVSCFATGTRIRTTRGEVKVEELREGDVALTGIDGSEAPVVWIGHREVDCARHPDPQSVWPVRIKAGAFGRGMPKRALTLSPDHAVYVNEVLVPVKHLINGTTIAQVKVDRVTYYHVELPRHDVLYADGMPAESYLDVGDRSNFANGGSVVRLHIDLAHHWEAGGCAPLVIYGPELEGVRALVGAAALAASASRNPRTRASSGRAL